MIPESAISATNVDYQPPSNGNADALERIQALEHAWPSSVACSAIADDACRLLASDPDPGVRWRAAEILRYAPSTLERLRVLRHGMFDEHYYVQYHSREVWRDLVSSSEFICACIECLRSGKNEHGRAEAADALGRLKQAAQGAIRQLMQSAREDASPLVRRQATHAIGKLALREQKVLDTLVSLTNDKDEQVPSYSAISLARLGYTMPRVTQRLLAGLGCIRLRCHCLGMLGRLLSRRQLRGALPDQLVPTIIQEHSAKGVFPTIGLKRWNKGKPIVIPSRYEPGDKHYPWDGLDAFHHWRTHLEYLDEEHTTRLQVCVQTDWFPGIHCIALANTILHTPDDWDPASAPVIIEGRPTSSLIQYGFILDHLAGMRQLPAGGRTRRIDFAFGPRKDVRLIQLLMYAAHSKYFPIHYQWVNDLGAHTWQTFMDIMRRWLDNAHLSDLLRQQWYTQNGQPSIRYHLRYERPYDELAGGLQRLSEFLTTHQGDQARHELARDMTNLLGELEHELRTS